MSAPNSLRHLLTRRTFLRLVAASGAILVVRPTALASAGTTARRWSDPATWGGKLPGRGDVAIIRFPVLLDINATVAGVVIRRDGNLVFHPRRKITFTSTGNIVVRGKLTMRPEGRAVVHRLIFSGIDESRFVGGGMDPLPTDVGLWVIGAGRLDIAGSRKRAWTRTTTAVPSGATSIELQQDPIGWRVGDELAITPTLSPAVPEHYLAYDYARVKALSGRTITLSKATTYEHPAVDVGQGKVFTPEVLNLTRNVRIEGTARGRAHVFIHSSQPQYIRNAALRYLGPRQPDPEGFTRFVVGRYALHFHHCGDGSRRSLVKRVVVRDCGSHAFVPHESHGVTFRECISHNTFEDPYWWDHATNTTGTLYDRCVASLVKNDPPFRGYRLNGFFLGATDGNTARNCVAVGVQGSVGASGFAWPEDNDGVWDFNDCVSHNNAANGIFTWQNTPKAHVVSRFVGYHNGGYGIQHGAYINGYVYEQSILYANALGPLAVAAVSIAEPVLTFADLYCDAAGFAEYGVVGGSDVLQVPPNAPTRFIRCTFKGYTKAAFGFTCETCLPYTAQIQDCTFEGNEFWLASGIDPASVVEVRDPVHGAILLRRADLPGEYRPEWNASVTPAT